MKRKPLLVTVLAVVGVLSTSLAACGGIIFTTARLSEATMAASVDETTHQPIDKTDTFSSDTPIVFASAKLSNAPEGTEVAAEWIYVSGEAGIENYTIMTLSDKYDGTQYVYFSVTKPETDWPLGDYKVVLSIDGKQQMSIPFTVVASSSTTAPPSPTTAPPSPTTEPPSPASTLPKPQYLLASDEQYLALVEAFDSWGLDFDSIFASYSQQGFEEGWDTMWLGDEEDESQRVYFYRVGDSWIPEDPSIKPPNLLASDARYQELRETFDSWGLDFYHLFMTYSQQALDEGWNTMWLGDDEDEAKRVSFTRVGDNWQPDDAAPPEAGVGNSQVISVIMPKGDASTSIATFTNSLSAGDVILGFIELSGEFKSQDWSFSWSAEIVDPEGETIDSFTGHWVKNNHYNFNIQAKDDGDYKIMIRHRSRYDKDLLINIQPKGWS